jgi:hypothetical protein
VTLFLAHDVQQISCVDRVEHPETRVETEGGCVHADQAMSDRVKRAAGDPAGVGGDPLGEGASALDHEDQPVVGELRGWRLCRPSPDEVRRRGFKPRRVLFSGQHPNADSVAQRQGDLPSVAADKREIPGADRSFYEGIRDVRCGNNSHERMFAPPSRGQSTDPVNPYPDVAAQATFPSDILCRCPHNLRDVVGPHDDF